MEQNRADEILKKAQGLILHHGYEKVNMTDIAKACGISRPTLYKSFANKEEIIAVLVRQQIEHSKSRSESLLGLDESLVVKLEKFFDVWTVLPASTAIDTEHGRDLLSNVESYAPDAVRQLYQEFENYLKAILKKHTKRKGTLSPEELARILTLAAKGLKATCRSSAELRRSVRSLITITALAIQSTS